MCGIAGAVDRVGRRLFPIERLRAMTAALAHRGPDDEHHHVEPGLAMGCRRLAVVDVAGGRQPLDNEDGSVWVAVNGELFNDPEWREELGAKGHRFRTRCDTETWVHAYEEMGDALFEKARGQFAVALWDRNQRRLVLARDRAGICPLHYAERDGWLLFSSEIKGLLASGLVEAAPDPRGVDLLFSFFAAGSQRTCFAGVHSLPPAHFLRVDAAGIALRRYWQLDFPPAGEERRVERADELVDELESQLERAVRRRLRGDGPVASYLSGGLDSTLLLAIASRAAGAPLSAFAIGFDGAGPDERRKAADSAHVVGAPLTSVIMDRERIAGAVPELVLAAEGPVVDTSDACLLALAAEVRRSHFKVALTGEGADEALAGYAWYKGEKVLGLFGANPSGAIARWVTGLVGSKSGNPAPSPVPAAQQLLYAPLSRARDLLYSRSMWERLEGSDPTVELALPIERMARWHPLHRSLYVDYTVMLPGHLLLGKGDRVAMRSAIETRYPFLDEDLVAFSASLAPEYKLRGLTDKWLLRRLASRHLPRRIARRPKTMLRADRAQTLLGPYRPKWVDQLLGDDSLRRTGMFSAEAVARQRRSMAHGALISPRRVVLDAGLTAVVTTQLWHHLYFGGGLCELPAWTPPVVRKTT